MSGELQTPLVATDQAESPSPATKLKLSEVSAAAGIPASVLATMAKDDLFPQVIRGRAGHIYFPSNDVPSWTECIELLEEERDRRLRKTAGLLARLDREIEAVRNDIIEAREHPDQPLGVDFISLGDRFRSRPESIEGQSTVTGVLHAFSFERMGVVIYDDALREAREHTPIGDPPDTAPTTDGQRKV